MPSVQLLTLGALVLSLGKSPCMQLCGILGSLNPFTLLPLSGVKALCKTLALS
jgi:hypothetical protein